MKRQERRVQAIALWALRLPHMSMPFRRGHRKTTGGGARRAAGTGIGVRVASRREELGLSVEEVAARMPHRAGVVDDADFTVKAWSRMERGGMVHEGALRYIAEALEVDERELREAVSARKKEFVR